MTNQLVNLVEMAIVFSIHVTDLRFYLLTNAHEGNDGTETTEETLPTHASTQRKPSKLRMNTLEKQQKIRPISKNVPDLSRISEPHDKTKLRICICNSDAVNGISVM